MNGQGAISPEIGPLPLASDEALWQQATSRVRQHFEMCARGLSEPVPAALSAACSIIRSGGDEAEVLKALMRRLLVRTEIGSEVALRCLRVVARSGDRVDTERLSAALQLAGRPPRIALMALKAKLADADKPRSPDERRAERQRIRNRAMATAERLPGESVQERIARALAEAQDRAEREQALRRRELDYAYDHARVPQEQRRYGR